MWGKKNLLKHQKVSKYYESGCSCKVQKIIFQMLRGCIIHCYYIFIVLSLSFVFVSDSLVVSLKLPKDLLKQAPSQLKAKNELRSRIPSSIQTHVPS